MERFPARPQQFLPLDERRQDRRHTNDDENENENENNNTASATATTTTTPQIAEACAQAAANLTSANAEFVRQALIAPETVAEVLKVLYLGGGGGGADKAIGGGTKERGSKRAASCRQNSARVLRSICCGADASEVARWEWQALRRGDHLTGRSSTDPIFGRKV